MRMSRSFVAALLAAVTLAIMPVQPGHAQGVLGESGLVGELEGAKVQRDAPRPAKLGEAPMLAERVKAGKLPPVEQRVPDEPLVIKPVHEIGTYGGTWRRGFTGPGDVENGNRINASDKPLFWDFTGTEIVPSVAAAGSRARTARRFTLFLRKGMKWSDGAPFTADDFVFWFEDLYSNKEIVPTPIADMQPQGKPGRVVKIDDTTVQFQFDVPYYLFEDMMAGDTLIGGGQSVRQSQKFTFGAYSPKHYLSQFLPKNSSVDEVNAKAKEAGYENWVQYLHFKKDWALNPELPTLGPWKTVQPINTPDLGAGAQSLLLGGRHRGQPAALHRPGPAHPGREPRGPEPARDRRRVRPAGAAHRHRQAAGDPREPGEGRLHRPSRSGLQRLGLGAADQSELRRRSRDREVADQRRLPPRLVAGARPRPAQRDLLARRRHAGLGRAGRELALQSRARSTARPGRPTTSTRPTRCSIRSA